MIEAKPGEFRLITLELAGFGPTSWNDATGEAEYEKIIEEADMGMNAVIANLREKFPDVRFAYVDS